MNISTDKDMAILVSGSIFLPFLLASLTKSYDLTRTGGGTPDFRIRGC